MLSGLLIIKPLSGCFLHLNYRKLIQDYSCKAIKVSPNTGVCSIGKRSALTFIINIREAISFYSTVCLKQSQSGTVSHLSALQQAGGISIFMISLLQQTYPSIFEKVAGSPWSHTTVEVSHHSELR